MIISEMSFAVDRRARPGVYMHMHRLALVISVLLAAACGSGDAPARAAGSAAAPAPVATGSDASTNAGTPARASDPTPDPITKPLSEAEARIEAARLAKQAFEARTDLRHPDGTRVLPTFDPKDFNGGLVGDRWKFEISRPAGATIIVSFGRFGDHAKAEAAYASE